MAYFGADLSLAVIVAVAENGTVGKDNALPWRIPSDLQYFKRVTMGKPVIMGRKTYESIGRPLPGRANIVVSRRADLDIAGVSIAADIDAALAMAATAARESGASEVMVIGGAQLYGATIPLADKLYVTKIHASIEGDAKLPKVAWEQWRETCREAHPADDKNSHSYSFVSYIKHKII